MFALCEDPLSGRKEWLETKAAYGTMLPLLTRGDWSLMEKFVVAAVQQRMRLAADLAEFEQDVRRYVRIARLKGAHLIVFPELAGLMAAPPLLTSARAGLLKQADRGRQRQAGFWTRATSKLAAGTAGLLGTSFDREMARLLTNDAQTLWDAYENLFARLAFESGLTIIAGSLYGFDRQDGQLRNVASVFGPQGNLLGQQARVVTTAEQGGSIVPASGWAAISTPLGRLGLLVGPDMLYPEPARILAYQGVEMLIGVAACTHPALYHRMRLAMNARAQENQLYSLVSFLIGHNPFAPGNDQPFVGRSTIFAPVELTPRYSGIMVEAGTSQTETIIAAEWDMDALRRTWETSTVPMRHMEAVRVAAPVLTAVYQRTGGELPGYVSAPAELTADPTRPAIPAAPTPTADPAPSDLANELTVAYVHEDAVDDEEN